MNKIVTTRQLLFSVVMLSLAPIFRNIPKIVCQKAGPAGFLSIIPSALVTLLLAFIVFSFAKNFPAQNLYSIVKTITNTMVAKIFLILTLIWAVINITAALHFNAITAQGALTPFTPNAFLFTVMLLLAGYCLYNGIKVAMRISELLLIIILVVIAGLLYLSMQNFDALNLLPLTLSDTKNIITASPFSFCIFGFLIVYLFYADRLDSPQRKFTPFIVYTAVISLTTFLITLVTVGVQGAKLAGTYTFPIFSVIKRTSLLNIFERMEAFLILPSIVSDFVFISFFMSIIILSIKWLFSLKTVKYIAVPAFIGVYIIANLISYSKLNVENLYYEYVVILNSVFEVGLPIIFYLIYLLRRKHLVTNDI